MMKDNTTRMLDNQTHQAPAVQPLPEIKKDHTGLLWKISCVIGLVIGLVIGTRWWTVNVAEQTDVQDPADELNSATVPVAYTEEAVDVRLTNMYGVTLEDAFVDGHWVLREDQDVLVWMDLPTDIEELYGKVESTFPYEVKVGETGVIEIAITSSKNETVYHGTLEFVAADDLTLEAGVSHNTHSNSGDITFWNSSAYEMRCLANILNQGRKTYMHYALFTSAENDPIVFCGGYSSAGYSMQYDVRAIGDFDDDSYLYVHGGTYYEGLKGKMVPCEPAPCEIETPSDPVPMPLPEFKDADMSL